MPFALRSLFFSAEHGVCGLILGGAEFGRTDRVGYRCAQCMKIVRKPAISPGPLHRQTSALSQHCLFHTDVCNDVCQIRNSPNCCNGPMAEYVFELFHPAEKFSGKDIDDNPPEIPAMIDLRIKLAGNQFIPHHLFEVEGEIGASG